MRKRFESPLFFGVVLLLCATFAQSQVLRWDLGAPGGAGVATTSGGGGFAQLLAVPGASIAWCNYPANAIPCTNYAPTYTSPTSFATCASNAPIVLQGSSTCVATGDNFGNLGVWTLPGNYSYTLTVGGVTSGPYVVSLVGSTSVIYAAPGESVAHAVARLPAGGGEILFGLGVYPSGNFNCTTANIYLQGVGASSYNSPTAPTALTGGTILQGPTQGQQGCDNFLVKDLGVDCGSAWSAANGNAVPGACLGLFNAGQTVGANPVQHPLFSNVTCLGISTAAAAHCLIQENALGGLIENSRSFFMTHGMVQKGYDNAMRRVWGHGHSSDCFIFKSDVYAPGGNWTLSDFTCSFGTALGDTHGVVVQANNGGNVQNVQIATGNITGVTNAGILLWGNDNSDQLLQVVISGVNIDIQHTSGDCLINQGSVSDVQMGTFTCFNSAGGGIINQSIGTQNDFRYSNGTIANITGIGLDTIGRTSVSNVAFINISGNAIQTETSGITTQCNNSFTAIGGGNLAVVGSGSYKFCGDANEDISGDITFPLGLGPGKAAIASFPACVAALEGNHLIATTCNAGCVAGNTCTTGGTTHCEMYCNSSPAWVETGR